jgi:hypothetical protein
LGEDCAQLARVVDNATAFDAGTDTLNADAQEREISFQYLDYTHGDACQCQRLSFF